MEISNYHPRSHPRPMTTRLTTPCSSSNTDDATAGEAAGLVEIHSLFQLEWGELEAAYPPGNQDGNQAILEGTCIYKNLFIWICWLSRKITRGWQRSLESEMLCIVAWVRVITCVKRRLWGNVGGRRCQISCSSSLSLCRTGRSLSALWACPGWKAMLNKCNSNRRPHLKGCERMWKWY